MFFPKSWDRLSAGGYRENEQVVCGTHATLSFPIYPRRHLQGYPQLFFLHSVACFSFDPGQSRSIFDGGNLASLITGLCYKSCSFGSWEVVCLHSPEQPGALGQSPNLKEKCQTFRTVILLNDINTHSKRILLLLPLKHVLVFHTEHVRVSIQHIYFFPPKS